MAAGESAYDVARRQREKAARLASSADRWEKGAQGEVAVARILDDLPEGWFALHDLLWPGRWRANIDHIVVGPGGLYVVDAKNWSGSITVKDDVVRQNGYRRDEAVASAESAAAAVQEVVPNAPPCTGVLCFIHNEPIVGRAGDVLVCSTNNLRDLLVTRPAVLTADEVQRCLSAVRLIAREASVQRPPQPTTAPTPTRRARPGRRTRGRPVTALVGMMALLLAIHTGTFTKASHWVGQELAQFMTPEATQPADEPTVPAKKRRRDEKRQSNTG